jgi:hypothetical protein
MTILLEYEFGNKQLGTKTQERLGKPEPATYLVWDSPEEDLSNNCQKRVKPLFLAPPEEATMEEGPDPGIAGALTGDTNSSQCVRDSGGIKNPLLPKQRISFELG